MSGGVNGAVGEMDVEAAAISWIIGSSFSAATSSPRRASSASDIWGVTGVVPWRQRCCLVEEGGK
eukprot:15686010-Heterocapsa_arctica.AAC.1